MSRTAWNADQSDWTPEYVEWTTKVTGHLDGYLSDIDPSDLETEFERGASPEDAAHTFNLEN